jgi:ketosteroid isomerase-like protein
MSQANRKLASDEVFEYFRLSYDAVSRGDTEAYLDSLHDHVELHQSADIPGTAGTFHGKQGAMELLDELGESFGEIEWNPNCAYDLGDERYLVLLLPKGRGTGSGIELEAEVAHLLQMRDGKTFRLDAYVGWDKGLEAVGLKE